MTGITQMVLTQSEPIAGNRGKIVNSNSLVFGETAGTTLVQGDVSKMSSLNVANLPAIGTQAFTIEYWVYFTNIEFNEGIVHQNGQTIIGSGSILGGLAVLHLADAIHINNYLITNNRITIPSQAIASQQWELETWYHIAIVRNGFGQLAAWINGYRSPEGLFVNVNNYNLIPTLIGSWRNTYGIGTTNNFIGRLYNLKIVQGDAQYDVNNSTISVPRYPFTSNPQTKLLLSSPNGNTLQDGSFTSIVNPKAGTVSQTRSTAFNDAVSLYLARSSASSPFTGTQSGSYYFNGNISSYGTFTGGQGFNFSTGDFSIEWFAYSRDNNQYSTPWWYGATVGPTFGIEFSVSGSTSDIIFYSGVSTISLITVNKSSYQNLWTHWALVRQSGRLYLYQNGSLLNVGGTAFTTSLTDTSSVFYIAKQGSSATNQETFGGYITNLRVVKGLAVYTGAFTVPTANLQRIQNSNPFGGTNTAALRTDQVPYLIVP
jgi:hypothetical protein